MMSTIVHPKNLRYTFIYLLLSAFSTSALAAETPTWEGPYIGAYLGEAFGTNHASTDVGAVTDNSYFTNSDDINAVNGAGTFNKNPDATIAGFQAGQDWTWKKMVYGVVLDYSSLPLSASKSVSSINSSGDSYSVYTSMSTNWLLTLRGRLGYQTMLHWPSLLYATGGMAITQLKVNNDFSDNSSLAGAGSSNISSNQIGWTLGAGIELALFSHMSADFEYSYIGIPSVKTAGYISNTQGGFGIPAQSMTSPFSTTGQFHVNELKVGLKYRF